MKYGVMVNGLVQKTFKTPEQAEAYIRKYYSYYCDVAVVRL